MSPVLAQVASGVATLASAIFLVVVVMDADKLIKVWNTVEKSRAPTRKAKPGTEGRPKAVEKWEGCFHGEPTDRLIIYLRSSGCHFALKTAGCTMCAHALIDTTFGRPIALEDYVRQFKEGLAAYEQQFPIVCIYNEGNMLNDQELPFQALASMVRMTREAGARRLVLESRTEYINPSVLEQLRAHAGDEMELEIGIGLESSNDFIRRVILQKEMTLPAFERAVALMRKHGVRALAYVVLKPPFLTEGEAIFDAVATTNYAFTVGVDVVSIEPIGVEPFTLLDSLHKAKLFRPPWLWSVVEVAQAVAGRGEMRLGGLQFAPIPETVSKNCGQCEESVMEALRLYNHRYDPGPLFGVRHSCRTAWSEDVGNWKETVLSEVRLEERIKEVGKLVPLADTSWAESTRKVWQRWLQSEITSGHDGIELLQ